MVASSGPPAPYESQPKKRSGCLVALYVLFGIGLLGLVIGGIGVWAFLRTEEGQRVLQVAQDGAAWVVEASNAPGTPELRELGCEAAMVSNADAAVDVFMTLIPEAEKQEQLRNDLASGAGENLDELRIIVCTVGRFAGPAPDCAAISQTYSRAVYDAPDSFYVLAIRQGQDAPSCQGIYASDGTLLREPELPQQ